MLLGLTAKPNNGPAPNLYCSGVRWNRDSVLALLPLIDCAGCGKCCTVIDDVMVQDYERQRIEEYIEGPLLGLIPNGEHWTMPQPCQFHSKMGCRIYPARPVVCKYFPLTRLDREEGPCVGVFTEFCESGRRAIAQLQQLQGWQR